MAVDRTLPEILSPHDSISIIGTAKNAGKTTVLNYLIRSFRKSGVFLGLTSIGRDGESVDLVTKTPKPKVFVYPGHLLATTEGLLSLCDITKEVTHVTDISTPLGRVVITRALSGGFVQLGGPSITTQLPHVMQLMKSAGATKIIVDGAISRKTLANPTITNAAVLCTGAALNKSMARVIADTAHTVRMLTLPKFESSESYETVLHIPGAVSDSLANSALPLRKCRGSVIVADDASKIFITAAGYARLTSRGVALMVKTPINLVGITINPTSPHGIGFDAHDFLALMRAAVDVPVFDVMEGL